MQCSDNPVSQPVEYLWELVIRKEVMSNECLDKHSELALLLRAWTKLCCFLKGQEFKPWVKLDRNMQSVTQRFVEFQQFVSTAYSPF